MRRGKHRKFGRERNLRNALYKSLSTALIEHGKITTTEAKAKSLSQVIEKLITTAKKQEMPARRLLLKEVGVKAEKKLSTEIARAFADRAGGYTRITRLGQRKSDGAPMAQIEFVS